MKIVHISAECFPAAKAGGLADVVGALPKYQNREGNNAMVFMPHYYTPFRDKNKFKQVYDSSFKLGYYEYFFKVFRLLDQELGFEIYSFDIPGLFDRDKIYSYHDDTERFVGFQLATIQWMLSWDKQPDIIHCHDQHTGLIPFMVANVWDYQKLKNVPTVFTIHNGQYQGQFGFDKAHLIPPFHSYYTGLIEWQGLINPLASAIKCAWKITTVSPSYLEEIGKDMNGLDPLLRIEREKSLGILNGIDNEVWNPETDTLLEKNYKTTNLVTGKTANKKWLCKEFNLDPKLPLYAFIGRLVGEKGADLLPHAIYTTLTQNRGKQNILILGTGEPQIQQSLWDLEPLFKGNYCAFIGYNERLSHIIYAGADFLLMPSRVEPCGLNQMYALKYGTIPIVRRIGGLKDTIVDIGDGGFGICHDLATAGDIIHSINRANELYSKAEMFKKLQKEVMLIDHSWDRSASEYISLYKSLIH